MLRRPPRLVPAGGMGRKWTPPSRMSAVDPGSVGSNASFGVRADRWERPPDAEMLPAAAGVEALLARLLHVSALAEQLNELLQNEPATVNARMRHDDSPPLPSDQPPPRAVQAPAYGPAPVVRGLEALSSDWGTGGVSGSEDGGDAGDGLATWCAARSFVPMCSRELPPFTPPPQGPAIYPAQFASCATTPALSPPPPLPPAHPPLVRLPLPPPFPTPQSPTLPRLAPCFAPTPTPTPFTLAHPKP